MLGKNLKSSKLSQILHADKTGFRTLSHILYFRKEIIGEHEEPTIFPLQNFPMYGTPLKTNVLLEYKLLCLSFILSQYHCPCVASYTDT